jgi:ubiquinone biosynthesis protein
VRIHEIPGQVRKAARLADMTAVLAKYGVVSASGTLNPIDLLSRLRSAKSRREGKARAYRKIIEELGTTYIKFGQWLSVRPDFVPPEVIHELERLQDHLPPVPFRVIQRTIQRETGKPLDQIFSRFDPQPISTASIAQVHVAVLRTGEKVAVKVQHPNLKRLIKADLEILQSVANWAEGNWPQLKLHRLDEAIFTFQSTLMDEIDFTIEANNQMRMAKLFEGTPWVRVPKVYTEPGTERFLVMEYLPGLKASQHDRFPEWGLDSKLLAQRLGQAMFRQIFEFGFFQSDPHPGNILFMKDNAIGLVDFGIIESFDRILRDKLVDWIYAAVYRDVDLFTQTFLDVAKPLASIDLIQFRNDCIDYLDEIHFQSAERISFARLLRMTNRLQYKYKISSPPTFVSIFKTISTLEGLARRLDPDFDWRAEWGPGLRKIFEERYSVESLHKKYWNILKDYDRLTAEFPNDFREVIKRVKEGKIAAEIYIPELQGYVVEIRSAMYMLATSIVIASIVFGLFFLGRGQGFQFLPELLGAAAEFRWVIVALVIMLLYIRKPKAGAVWLVMVLLVILLWYFRKP